MKLSVNVPRGTRVDRRRRRVEYRVEPGERESVVLARRRRWCRTRRLGGEDVDLQGRRDRPAGVMPKVEAPKLVCSQWRERRTGA